MSRFAFILPGLLCLTLCPAARATLIAYDGFENYTVNAALNTNTGGTGWSTNWSSATSVKAVATATPITYSSGALTINGGARAAEAADPVGNNGVALDNLASRSFATQTGTVYFSFLFRAESGGGADDFIQFALNNDTNITNSGSIGDLSNVGTTANFAARIGVASGGTSVNSSTSLANATTFFLVGKISKTSGGNYNRMQLFVNPTTLTEPGVVSATQNADSGTSAISFFTMRISNLETTDQYRFDELRIGTTWGDVTAVPEPATYGMILGSLVMAAVVWSRRRRTR
jgi:hypothetical protein